jgi:transcriptional regulator with GAF, ATPase, and Fis domain
VLQATDGRIYGAAGAAAILGMPPSTLQSKMKKLGI